MHFRLVTGHVQQALSHLNTALDLDPKGAIPQRVGPNAVVKPLDRPHLSRVADTVAGGNFIKAALDKLHVPDPPDDEGMS